MAASRGESATGLLEVYYLDGGVKSAETLPPRGRPRPAQAYARTQSVELLLYSELAENSTVRTPIIGGSLFGTLYTLTRVTAG